MAVRVLFAAFGIAILGSVSGCKKEHPRQERAIDSPGTSAKTRDAGHDARLIPTELRPVIVQVSVGYEHACALTNGGAVHCWGHGKDGRLGYGHTRSIGDDGGAAVSGTPHAFDRHPGGDRPLQQEAAETSLRVDSRELPRGNRGAV